MDSLSSSCTKGKSRINGSANTLPLTDLSFTLRANLLRLSSRPRRPTMSKMIRITMMALFLMSNLNLFCASLVAGEKKEDADASFSLDATNFNSTLLATTSPFAIVEFYAHWCPACRNYKPQYEQVARLFNGPDAVHPGILFMANVDCALKVNNMLCDQFKVSHYPTLLWAPLLKSAWVTGTPAGWEMIQNAYNAELLLQAINSKMGKSYTLGDVRYFKEPSLIQGGQLNFQKVAVSIYDIEEATAKSMDIIVADKLLSHNTRPAFIQLLQLLVVHHPSRNCKRGAADLLTNLEDYWPSFSRPESEKGLAGDNVGNVGYPDFKALATFHICGDHAPHDKWMFCRGSRKDTRGYSCGLWLLFHALSVRVEDKLAAVALRTICGFVGNFFNCRECSEHFLQFCSSANGKVSSRRELVLWLWDVHNKVNERLSKEEASLGTADPEFLKKPWPSEVLCKSCWKAQAIKQETENRTEENSFQHPEVYDFLVKFYGQALLTPNVTESSMTMKEGALLTEPESVAENSITITLGVALAVAFACCGFATIACFWRNQRKKRNALFALLFVHAKAGFMVEKRWQITLLTILIEPEHHILEQGYFNQHPSPDIPSALTKIVISDVVSSIQTENSCLEQLGLHKLALMGDGGKKVFVTVGTTSFDDLIRAIDSPECKAAISGKGYSSLLIQMGRGSYIPSQSSKDDSGLEVNFFRFEPNLQDHMKSASLIISHAGSGSIFEALRLGKPLLVIVNEALMDNHQVELAEELAAHKYLYYASPKTLVETINNMNLDTLVPYEASNPSSVVKSLNVFLGFHDI